MTTSETIKNRRECLGYSQAELSRMAEITPGALSQIESGKRTPATQTLMRISTALGVSIDHLMGKEVQEEHDIFMINLHEDISSLAPNYQLILRHFVDALRKSQ